VSDARKATSEAERIRRVYAHYDADPATRLRWDPAQPGNAENWARLRKRLAALLPRIDGMDLLEIGCGPGDVLQLMKEIGAREEKLTGVDLREGAIRQARLRFPRARLDVVDAESLPFGDAAFDAVLLFTVLSSVLSRDSQEGIAREAMRVLRPGGVIVWYEMRLPNPWNRNVRPVARGELGRLFPELEQHLSSATLIPHVARKLGAFTGVLFPVLHALPLLRSHWLGLLRKPLDPKAFSKSP
jgi:ubiquinone/menaquinone biosynthesis C-methylase UbiE